MPFLDFFEPMLVEKHRIGYMGGRDESKGTAASLTFRMPLLFASNPTRIARHGALL
jgi:hypothetical protein